MRKFENAKMTLFDSANANFRLAVEAQFVKGNKDIGYKDLVYITERYSAILNPNLYLTLAFKGEETLPVYTSYPQIFGLRRLFGTVKDIVLAQDAFIPVDGKLEVNPKYVEPSILNNIGKNNNWISISLAVVNSGENGVVNYIPGVSIELSTSNGFISLLTIDEFLTVYSIIEDINLPQLQATFSLGFLDIPLQQSNYAQTNYQQNQQPRRQMVAQPAGNTMNNYSRAKYTATPQQQNRIPAQQPTPTQNYSAPISQSQQAPKSGRIMNSSAIDEMEIDEINYDDDAALDAIFKE